MTDYHEILKKFLDLILSLIYFIAQYFLILLLD